MCTVVVVVVVVVRQHKPSALSDNSLYKLLYLLICLHLLVVNLFWRYSGEL